MRVPGRRKTGAVGNSAGATLFLTGGLELALSVLVGFFLGRWLDDIWGTTPWLLIVCLVLGTAGGFIHFIREAVAAGKKQDELSKDRRGQT